MTFPEKFPKHLEYDVDEEGYPIIESRKDYEEKDFVYEEIKSQEELERETEDLLERMLNNRHHLRKRFYY